MVQMRSKFFKKQRQINEIKFIDCFKESDEKTNNNDFLHIIKKISINLTSKSVEKKLHMVYH